MDNKKISIIGAGPGGLTAGMILAKRGFDVSIYEKDSTVGGRNKELEFDGFSFDVGPTFLMMQFILEEMFAEAGKDANDYLEFVRLDPMYRLVFNDVSLDITEDRKRLQDQINQYFPGNEDSLDKFLKKESKRFEYLYPCLQKDYSSFKEYFRPIFLKALPHIPLGKSMIEFLGNYFNQEKLRIVFTFQSKYLGMSPWDCPGFFTLLPLIEHKFGVYHVKGGLNKISEAMKKVFEENGGKIYLNSPVKKIITEKGAAKGLILEDGQEILSDEVIINADFSWAATNLFDEGVLKKYNKNKIEKMEYSCSTLMFYIALDTIYEDLAHHTIVFADDYKKNVDDIFKRGKVDVNDPSFYVRNSSINDPDVAPEGKSGLYILVPVPNNQHDNNWDELSDQIYKKVIERMKERLNLSDLEEKIINHKIITPLDWENKLNVYRGAVFSSAHILSQMLTFRPHNKFEDVNNCYLVGGGTHPGSGLPTIYESGRISANMISKKHGVEFEYPKTDLKK